MHRLPVLVPAGRAHPDDPAPAVRGLAQPDHLARRGQRVAGPDRQEPARLGIAEVRHGVEADVRHGLAEDEVEGGEIVDRAPRQPAGAGELVRGGEREAAGIERDVERALAFGDGARHRVGQDLADRVVLEEVPRPRLASLRERPVAEPGVHGRDHREDDERDDDPAHVPAVVPGAGRTQAGSRALISSISATAQSPSQPKRTSDARSPFTRRCATAQTTHRRQHRMPQPAPRAPLGMPGTEQPDGARASSGC